MTSVVRDSYIISQTITIHTIIYYILSFAHIGKHKICGFSIHSIRLKLITLNILKGHTHTRDCKHSATNAGMAFLQCGICSNKMMLTYSANCVYAES